MAKGKFRIIIDELRFIRWTVKYTFADREMNQVILEELMTDSALLKKSLNGFGMLISCRDILSKLNTRY
jgi:hypothetical protein